MDKSIKLLVSDSNSDFPAILAELISSDPRIEIVNLARESMNTDISILNTMLSHMRLVSPAFSQTLSSLESRITDILNMLGIPVHIKGFHYVRKAIAITMENGEAISTVTKILYPSVAKTYNTTPSRVERAIRHAIEVAWDRYDSKTFKIVFGHNAGRELQRPTNSEFIARIADYLQLQSMEE